MVYKTQPPKLRKKLGTVNVIYLVGFNVLLLNVD